MIFSGIYRQSLSNIKISYKSTELYYCQLLKDINEKNKLFLKSMLWLKPSSKYKNIRKIQEFYFFSQKSHFLAGYQIFIRVFLQKYEY